MKSFDINKIYYIVENTTKKTKQKCAYTYDAVIK